MMRTARQAGALLALFAAAFGLTWLATGVRNAGSAGEHALRATPSLSRRSHEEARRTARPAVELVAPTHTFAQRLIADDPETGAVTVTMIERTAFDLTDSRLRAGMSRREPRLPRDCFPSDGTPVPVDWQVRVTVEPERVTVSDYRVTSANLAAPVAACLEDYFAGEATRDVPHEITLRAMETVFGRTDHYLVSGREAAARMQARGLEPADALSIP